MEHFENHWGGGLSNDLKRMTPQSFLQKNGVVGEVLLTNNDLMKELHESHRFHGWTEQCVHYDVGEDHHKVGNPNGLQQRKSDICRLDQQLHASFPAEVHLYKIRTGKQEDWRCTVYDEDLWSACQALG